MKTQYIPSLNGLRAICILLVVGDHLFAQHYIPNSTTNRLLDVVLYNGGLGVGFFFVISGYLITTLLIKENDRTGTISLKSFYLRRTLRIFPAYYFLLTIYFLLQSIGFIYLNPLNWAVALTYTTQFLQNPSVEIIHLWSLSVEELFYLLWPLLFILFFRKGNINYLFAAVLLFPIFRFFNYSYPTYPNSKVIFCNGDALLIGCLTAIYYKRISKWVIDHSRLALMAFPLLILSLYTDAYIFHLIPLVENPTKRMLVEKVVMPAMNALFSDKGLFVNLMIAVVVVYSINIKNEWYKFLNLKAVNYVGILSYSIYLWQEIFITPEAHKISSSIPLIVLLTFITANLSYHLIEKPILTLKDKDNLLDVLRLRFRLKRAG